MYYKAWHISNVEGGKNMEKKIITISREFGSGGRFIGKQLAEKMGIAFYDKDIIAKVAEETGFSEEFVEQKAEHSPSKNIFAYAFVGRNSAGMSIDDYLYTTQRKIILDIAEKESCVIVGRCADYILKERRDVLNVFIHGEQPEKTKRICQLYQKTEKEALAMMKDMDKKRSINYEYYTDQKWGNIKNYDVTLNSSTFGYERCVEMIEEMAK